MYLNKISLLYFKNINEASLQFSPKLNCITGLNGSGKTNLLDAIYYLSMTKSYFTSSDIHSISYDSEKCRISGDYIREDETVESINIKIGREGEKSVKRNLKAYSRLSEHIGLIPIVMVSPYDNCLINESGEERRRFINSILSQLDKEYLRKIQNYNHLLFQRNKLLKNQIVNEELLFAYSVKMSENATYIHRSRGEFTKMLVPLADKYYKLLSGGRENIEILYKSDLDETTPERLFERSLERDKLLKYTTSGIQRDDLQFFMDGHLYKIFGSQGQQKSFLISLKLAQFEIMRDIYKRTPLLLLDDVFDKLDMERVEALLNLVSSNLFGQIFVTDSNKVRVETILKKINGSSASFEVVSGRFV